MKNSPLKTSISVVIPVYNSQESLSPLLERLFDTLPELADHYEVILINDGSRDDSWQIIQQMTQQYPALVGINLMRNYGQHNAILCGVRQAKYELIVTMDDDLQHPPEELPKLLAKLEEGYDVVYGSPQKMPHNFWRNLSSQLTKKILAFVMGIKTVREISAFRVFRSHLRKAFAKYQNPGIILDVLLSWGTTKFASVTVNEVPRPYGRSNYSFGKLIGQAILVLTGYSTVPLRITSWLGFTITIFGVIIFFKVIFDYFLLGSIPGFTFLASIISLFSGAILFALGIFGEYLARIFDKSMDRPAYVVSDILNAGVENAPPSQSEPTTVTNLTLPSDES